MPSSEKFRDYVLAQFKGELRVTTRKMMGEYILYADGLVDEFAHARYGGGKRDGFENKETWKLAMQLMGLKEDD